MMAEITYWNLWPVLMWPRAQALAELGYEASSNAELINKHSGETVLTVIIR